MIYRYLLILIACGAVLLGIQVPNFVDQYEKRLDAHLVEVTGNLRGFQEIADRLYGGSLDALIRHHEESADTTFREEAKPIRAMHERYRRFSGEQAALQTHLAAKLAHLLFRADREIRDEALARYSFAIPLNETAVASGAGVALLAVLATELLMALLRWILRLARPAPSRSGRF